ncbi:hypothetical protein B0F90DRAFT_1672731 [Multifurca ochricompacta]|uniref:Uncharacterized protein n=1 Tax=Multifurca ochricompacta TaxID=376703 RepID=A0AAD4QDR1_9AGAM|nr:hypothetical protein B0F90DRAFT_1672731 [Multifurca ochricompacta]
MLSSDICPTTSHGDMGIGIWDAWSNRDRRGLVFSSGQDLRGHSSSDLWPTLVGYRVFPEGRGVWGSIISSETETLVAWRSGDTGSNNWAIVVVFLVGTFILSSLTVLDIGVDEGFQYVEYTVLWDSKRRGVQGLLRRFKKRFPWLRRPLGRIKSHSAHSSWIDIRLSGLPNFFWSGSSLAGLSGTVGAGRGREKGKGKEKRKETGIHPPVQVVSTADNENGGRALGLWVYRVARVRLSGSFLWQLVGATGDVEGCCQGARITGEDSYQGVSVVQSGRWFMSGQNSVGRKFDTGASGVRDVGCFSSGKASAFGSERVHCAANLRNPGDDYPHAGISKFPTLHHSSGTTWEATGS